MSLVSSIWLSVDPLAYEFPSWTPYHYVHNNPVNLVDPTGMSAEDNNPPSRFTNTIISGFVDQNNSTHIVQTEIQSLWHHQEDGSVCITESITQTTNSVRNSDGKITYGDVVTSTRIGERDSEGNFSFSQLRQIDQRSQTNGEFTNLDSWTNFISDYSANNTENYNIQSHSIGSSRVKNSGALGLLPVSLFGGGAISFLGKNTSTIARTLKIPLNASSGSYAGGHFLESHTGKNNSYFQIYGVSQQVNGVTTKLMRLPNQRTR
jgi:hypothetical protein